MCIHFFGPLRICRSQWPRGLRRRSTAAGLLRLWVRIPMGAWMSVCCECCVLSGRGLCDELITRPEEPYRLWYVVVCDLETSRTRKPWSALGRSATGGKNTERILKILLYVQRKTNLTSYRPRQYLLRLKFIGYFYSFSTSRLTKITYDSVCFSFNKIYWNLCAVVIYNCVSRLSLWRLLNGIFM